MVHAGPLLIVLSQGSQQPVLICTGILKPLQIFVIAGAISVKPTPSPAAAKPVKKPVGKKPAGKRGAPSGARRAPGKPTKKPKLQDSSDSEFEVLPSAPPTTRRRRALSGGWSPPATTKPQQCQGPGCVYAARTHSKYCSDECGIQLAIK